MIACTARNELWQQQLLAAKDGSRIYCRNSALLSFVFFKEQLRDRDSPRQRDVGYRFEIV